MQSWEQEVEDYENEIGDQILSEEEIMLALELRLPEAHGFAGNMGRHHIIRQTADRLANYRPRFVESVDEFTDL